MVFSSSLFLFYFLPVFLLFYYLSPGSWKNYTALAASLLFYTWGAPLFVFVLSGSMLADFYLFSRYHELNATQKKIRLWLAILLNVGLLLYFKYANFFVENLDALLGIHISWSKVALPIGISFFTFHKLSYAIDIHRGAKAPFTRLGDYVLYILLFPQLIAGPIIRFNEIADQFIDRRANEKTENYLAGFFRFVIGLSKKVIIANVLGEEADRIFSLEYADLNSSLAWLGALAYTFQIYFDFSGYSDMAIGLALMMGFKFPENFHFPYISQSITEFWRRWHISLGNWMREYLYIPLGGNRVSTGRMYLNLWIVFLISGFWHGAEWTFIAWGAYHGLFLVLERLFLNKALSPLGRWPRTLLTFFLVLIGWIFFRAENIGQALHFLQLMFRFDLSGFGSQLSPKIIVMFLLAILFSFSGALGKLETLLPAFYKNENSRSGWLLKSTAVLLLFIVCMGEVLSSGFNPFIYFRF